MTDRLLLPLEKDVHETVLLRRIIYVTVKLNYSTIYLINKRKLTVRLSLNEMEKILPAEMFCRVHRSYIISLHHLQSVKEDTITAAREKIPFGKSYRKDLFGRFPTI